MASLGFNSLRMIERLLPELGTNHLSKHLLYGSFTMSPFATLSICCHTPNLASHGVLKHSPVMNYKSKCSPSFERRARRKPCRLGCVSRMKMPQAAAMASFAPPSTPTCSSLPSSLSFTPGPGSEHGGVPVRAKEGLRGQGLPRPPGDFQGLRKQRVQNHRH